MKCPNCQSLCSDADKVCYTCKRYIGNERASDTIGGDTNYARLLPLVFVVCGVPAFHMALPRVWSQVARHGVYDGTRIWYSVLAGLTLLVMGYVLGKLLGDGQTVRI
jgi:hypothetical protein